MDIPESESSQRDNSIKTVQLLDALSSESSLNPETNKLPDNIEMRSDSEPRTTLSKSLENSSFDEAFRTKLISLDQALPSSTIFEADLQQVLETKLHTCQEALDEVTLEVVKVCEENAVFTQVRSTDTSTETDLVQSHPSSELQTQLDRIEAALADKLRSDAIKHDHTQSPGDKFKRVVAGLAEKILHRQLFSRDKLYQTQSSFDHPFDDFFASQNFSLYSQTDFAVLSIEELVHIKTNCSSDLENFPLLQQALLGRVSDLCQELRLSSDAQSHCTRELSGFLNRHNSLRYLVSDIDRQIRQRHREIHVRASSLNQRLEQDISEIVDLYKPLIQPQISGDNLPEGVWWTKETLDMFVHSHTQLSSLREKLDERTDHRTIHIVNTGIKAIENKLLREIYPTIISYKDELDLQHSPDVVYHSSSALTDVVAIIAEGRIKSLGALRQEKGSSHPRATDHKGGGKKQNQEIHQIYLNTLGKDETYPHGYTRNPYSPIRVSIDLIKDDPETMALLEKQVQQVRAERQQYATLLEKYQIATACDHSRFVEYEFSTTNAMGDQATFGLPDRPKTFYIATGFFFMKKDVLQSRQFSQSDGIALFDQDYTSQQDDNYLEINWQDEGCFVTDKLGWGVIKNALKQYYQSHNTSPDQALEQLKSIEANVVILEEGLWGDRFHNAQNIFVGPYPSIRLDDGSTMSAQELMFLDSYPYLDEQDKERKRQVIEKQKGIQRFNQEHNNALAQASQRIAAHLRNKTQVIKPGRIVPTLRLGDLPNAAGSTPVGGLYKIT